MGQTAAGNGASVRLRRGMAAAINGQEKSQQMLAFV
jgi:hypothetical protein